MYTLEQVREQIAEAAWTQSKGYARSSDGKPVAPHQYIVKQRQPIAYSIIRWWLDHSPDSYQGAYGGYKYTYWNDQGWRYWSMGVILNRVPIEDAAQDPMAAPDPNAVDYLATRPAER